MMTIHIIFASIFIACVIGLITSTILSFISKKAILSFIMGGFVFGMLSVITGGEIHYKLHYREIRTPELEDVNEHRAVIDTIYTICNDKIDTTYSAHWIGRKTGRR